MLIIPAIDIIGGQCVRLTKGDYGSKKVYSNNPIKQAKEFERDGASMIHIVDLDGAKMGKPQNINTILKIRETLNIPMQVGGGIRNISDAEWCLKNGVDRVIIGTKAIDDSRLIPCLLERYGASRIVVGIDIRKKKIATSGWMQTVDLDYMECLKNLQKLGVTDLVVTDIEKDGTLTEPNYTLITEIQNMGYNVIASGGVSDTSALEQLFKNNVSGAIIGKALYEGKIRLIDALRAVTKNTLTKRIIPCLDVKDGRTVKGFQFESLRDAGDPVELAKRYEKEGADELVFLDITASKEKRKIVKDLVKRVAQEIFIPFTVGGGIETTEDINELLRCGVDKVSINTMAVQNPSCIEEGSKMFGSQCIVVAIDVKKRGDQYEVYINGGRDETQWEAISWAKEVERLGAGEILLTSMDRDGSQSGYDTDLLTQITNEVNIPVIASGGAGRKEDIAQAFLEGNADAVLAASIFHFKKHTISEVKQYLVSKHLPIRL